jgi:hypothetical protein
VRTAFLAHSHCRDAVGVDSYPETWAIQTREGGTGILEITGLSDTPRGVKIRYKLVKPATPSGSIAPNTFDENDEM